MFCHSRHLNHKCLSLLACLIIPASVFAQSLLAPCPADTNQTWSQCLGTIEKEGSKYSGEFLDNLFHGKGMYFFEGGDYFSGQFKEGLPNGWGIYLYAADNKQKGDRYVGQFKDGQAHGRGTTFFKIGAVYSGEYSFGLPDGLGTYIHQDGLTVYEGEWLKGKFVKPSFVANRPDESETPSAELQALNGKVRNLQDELTKLKITETQLRQMIEAMQQTLLVQSENSMPNSDIKTSLPSVHPIVELKSQDLKNKDSDPSTSQASGVQLIKPIKAQVVRKKNGDKNKIQKPSPPVDPMKDAFLYLQ